MKKSPLITLTSDFGSQEPFVGIMEGVMLGINPSIKFIHLSHEIKPHNILQALYLFGSAYSYFPAGTIHLIVVDPGVGSNRKIILAESKKYCFLAPDNGVLSAVFQKEKELSIYQLTPEKFITEKVSSTFQGRDIFAPTAALLSLNNDPASLGNKIDSAVTIKLPLPKKVSTDQFEGEIVYIDRFGNLISNFSDQFLSQNIGKKKTTMKIGSHSISGLKSHYSEASPKEISAIINSWNNLEIFLKEESAADFLNAQVGSPIEISC